MAPPPRIQDLDCMAIEKVEALQPRLEIDGDLIVKYKAEMEEGVEFDPIEVVSDGKTHWLTDGNHRLAAAMELGRKTIKASVIVGSYNTAVLHAARANSRHGSPRKSGDKRRQVEMALSTKEGKAWSDSEVARWCCVSHTLVGTIRKSSLATVASDKAPVRTYTTKSGTVAEMKTGNIGKKAPPRPEPTAPPSRVPPRPEPTPEPKETPASDVLTDCMGFPLPDDQALHLAFELVPKSKAIRNAIIAIAKSVNALAKEPGGTLFEWRSNQGGIKQPLHTLRAYLASNTPFAVCPYWPQCRSKSKCKACFSFGWLSQDGWNIVPAEVKAARAMAIPTPVTPEQEDDECA